MPELSGAPKEEEACLECTIQDPVLTRTIKVTHDKIGHLIGQGGGHLRLLREVSGAHVELKTQPKEEQQPAELTIQCESHKMRFAIQLAISACHGGFVHLLFSAKEPVPDSDLCMIEKRHGVSIFFRDTNPPGCALHALVVPNGKDDAQQVPNAVRALKAAQEKHRAPEHRPKSKEDCQGSHRRNLLPWHVPTDADKTEVKVMKAAEASKPKGKKAQKGKKTQKGKKAQKGK